MNLGYNRDEHCQTQGCDGSNSGARFVAVSSIYLRIQKRVRAGWDRCRARRMQTTDGLLTSPLGQNKITTFYGGTTETF